MPRRRNPDLIQPWKINLPATLAAQIEYRFFDNFTQRPRYGARGKLLAMLLTYWLARENGTPDDQMPPFPRSDEIMLTTTE